MAEARDGDLEVQVVGAEVDGVRDGNCVDGVRFVEFCDLGGEHVRREALGGGCHGWQTWLGGVELRLEPAVVAC